MEGYCSLLQHAWQCTHISQKLQAGLWLASHGCDTRLPAARCRAASAQEAEPPTRVVGKGGRTASPPPGAHYRSQQMKISLVSPNMLAEPYK